MLFCWWLEKGGSLQMNILEAESKADPCWSGTMSSTRRVSGHLSLREVWIARGHTHDVLVAAVVICKNSCERIGRLKWKAVLYKILLIAKNNGRLQLNTLHSSNYIIQKHPSDDRLLLKEAWVHFKGVRVPPKGPQSWSIWTSLTFPRVIASFLAPKKPQEAPQD